jgi:hypothetical protein
VGEHGHPRPVRCRQCRRLHREPVGRRPDWHHRHTHHRAPNPRRPGEAGRRRYHLDGHAIIVNVAQAPAALHFTYDAPNHHVAAHLEQQLGRTFPRMIGNLI